MKTKVQFIFARSTPVFGLSQEEEEEEVSKQAGVGVVGQCC